MSSDPNRKSQRSFQCRDILWETFEQMARELECSVDYLINESMKQYARQRSYGARTPYPTNLSNAPPAVGRRPVGSVLPPPPRSRPNLGAEPQPGYGAPNNDFQQRPATKPFEARPVLPVPPPAPQMPAIAPVPGPQSVRGASGRSVPPPIPSTSGSRPPTGGPSGFPAPHQSPGGAMGQPAALGQLSVICDGDKVSVNKERFVIGRGKQSSDFTLKDPNVSRQHAMVEFQNGAYFIVDMGSTNGIEFGGRRVARQQIQEGDTFKICDHEIRFTFR